jgi:thiol:disulfide interchange protein
MKAKLVLVFVLAAFVTGFATAAPAPLPKRDRADQSPDDDTVFHSLDPDKAVEKARKRGKVVLVVFGAKWCGPCKTLDKNAFSDARVQSLLKKKAVAIKIDVDDNPTLAKKYKVVAIPCMVVIDGEGKEVGRLIGSRHADKFLEDVGKLLDR